MNLPRKFLKFDYGVHILFGALAALSIVLTPLSEGVSIWLLFPLWFLLGAWQVLSAMFLALAYQNKVRAYYLLAVVVYGIALYFLLSTSGAEYLFFLSLIFAAWYAYQTYKDVTYRTPSFWDLEF